MRTITVMLALGLVGCGGEAFTGAEAIRVEAGTDEAAPDAGRDDEGGGNPAVDGGSEAESTTEAGHDAAPDVETDAGQVDAPTEGGSDPLAACVAYYRAYASGTACSPPTDGATNACGADQYDDAGGLSCTRNDLDRCGGPGGACGWDGGAQDYAQLCACVFACLGSCAPTNGLYFACADAWCGWR